MHEIEIFFAGTGNAFNTEGRANQAMLIRGEGFTYCVDAGPTLLHQLQCHQYDPASINTLFLTHFHGDHTAGIPFLLLYQWQFPSQDSPLTLAGPSNLKKQCELLFSATYPDISLGEGARYNEYPVTINKDIRLNADNRLDTYPMDHNPESLGYKFNLGGKIIAISGDTKWNENLLPLVDGADIAILECTSLRKSPYKHLSFEEINQNLSRLNAKTIIPVHMNTNVKDAFKKQGDPKFRLVNDGDRIRI